MAVAVGLVLLLGLTLYMSALAYTLRDYSRSLLSQRLKETDQRRWLDWLDGCRSDLLVLTGVISLAANLGVFVCLGAWYLRDQESELRLPALVVPGLLALLLLAVCAIGIGYGLAIHAGERILARSLIVLFILRTLLWPVARALAAVEFVIRRLLGQAEQQSEQRVEQEILDAVSEGEAQGAVHEDQKEIIESVFEFDQTCVDAIMTPRTDIHAVRADASYHAVCQAILTSGHSRIPVYEDSVDHIIGVLYAKDLLRLKPDDPFDARALMRSVPYVPETKSIHQLLQEFRQSKVQIAIVLDEYGGTAGLVTLEDILEELVGEIADEYDTEEPPSLERIDETSLEVDARVHVDEINKELGIQLPEEEDYETIGGFVFSTLGKIPGAGEEFQYNGIHFRIVAAEPRKIRRIRIHVAAPAKVE